MPSMLTNGGHVFILPTDCTAQVVRHAHLLQADQAGPRYRVEDLPEDSLREDVARLTETHNVEHIPPTERKRYPSKRCRVCCKRAKQDGPGARKHPKESVYYCRQCPSRPGLCIWPCFHLYHTQFNYWSDDDCSSVQLSNTEHTDGGLGEKRGEGGKATQCPQLAGGQWDDHASASTTTNVTAELAE